MTVPDNYYFIFLSSQTCHFQACHIKESYKVFCDRFLLLSIMLLKFTMLYCVSLLCSFFITAQYGYSMDILQLTHSSVDHHLGYFQLLVTINTVPMNSYVQIFMWAYIFIFLGQIPRNRITGSQSKSKSNFLETAKLFSKLDPTALKMISHFPILIH